MKIDKTIILIILTIVFSCSSKERGKLVLYNGELVKSMNIRKFEKEYSKTFFAQYNGFIFGNNFSIITSRNYLKIYNDEEVDNLKNDEIKGFRKQIVYTDSIIDGLYEFYKVDSILVGKKNSLYCFRKRQLIYSVSELDNELGLLIISNDRDVHEKIIGK